MKDGERLDDLECGTLRIIQDKRGYTFTMDAVLLANFARVLPNEAVLDLGTGSGVIPILLSHKTKAKKLVGIEVQERLCDMATRSVLLNGLEERVQIIHGDMRKLPDYFDSGSFDVVIANPPYYPFEKGAEPPDEKTACRSEVHITLAELVTTAAKLLKYGGNFFLVMKSERTADVLCTMREAGVEPKRILPVQPTPEKRIDTVLVEGKRGGKPGLIFEKPLVVFDKDGNYTAEIGRIYKQ